MIAVFADVHAHAEALEAVLAAADASGAEALWSLGDMVGAGADPGVVVARTRERCALALMGNHDYGATGSAEPTRFGAPGSPAARSIELARERLDEEAIAWLRSLKPAAYSGMPRWMDRLFIALARSASDATDFFHIPTGRVVEVGTQVTI